MTRAASSLPVVRDHPRTIGVGGTVALAMGGSNQSLFLIGAIIVSQGSAAVPLLIVGLLLSYAALPGWIELILIYPKRVGGIAASCAEAFRPYSPVLANLTGVCYWWGWVPTCGLTAILSGSALHQWYLPQVSVPVLATGLVLLFTAINLLGVRAATRVAIPIACASGLLALLSAVVPVVSGSVDWQQASSFHLVLPFDGPFGAITSAMAGLYLIGFAAPAFEAAACHVGETRDPERSVPRAMYLAAGVASLYFVVLPVVWLGALGSGPLGGELMTSLGPTFAPLLGGGAKAAAIWFMVLNMFHGTLQPLAGASRTLSQLADDGLVPRTLGRRSRRDVPWVATVLTAGMSILFLQSGDPPWVIAAANLTYLIGIGLPSIAVWLLRRNGPHLHRPYRARRGMIGLGLVSASAWLLATLLGFEQFGLPTVLAGLGMAYAGSALYAWRVCADRRERGEAMFGPSLHIKLTGAMIAVMVLDGAGYLLAVSQVEADPILRTALEDIFVLVAILTITVGLVLPGVIAHTVGEVSRAAARLSEGTISDLTRAMQALSRGDFEGAVASKAIEPLTVVGRDELGQMAGSFNVMQHKVLEAAIALDGAREGLRAADAGLQAAAAEQTALVALEQEARRETERANQAKSEFLSRMSHELRTPLNAILGFGQLLELDDLTPDQRESVSIILRGGQHLLELIDEVLDISRIETGRLPVALSPVDLTTEVAGAVAMIGPQCAARGVRVRTEIPDETWVRADPQRVSQVLLNLLTNAVKYNRRGGDVRVALGVAEAGRVVLIVTDTGEGIAEEDLSRLFHPFERLDAARRGVEGTGLGLALSRRLTWAMGGDIGVSSVVGQGTTFTVDLEATAAPRDLMAIEPRAELHRGIGSAAARQTVLHVEDHDLNIRLIERHLGARANLVAAASGTAGIELARSLVPDLVLLDLHLPDLDGEDVLACLREDPVTQAIPVIVLTADAGGDRAAAALAAGADGVLIKPLDLAGLDDAIATILGQERVA